LQISVLELLESAATKLTRNVERSQWLFSRNLLDTLLAMAGGTEAKVDGLLGGPALRAVAALCKVAYAPDNMVLIHDIQLLEAFHHALHNFEITGETDRLVLIDAISSLASISDEALTMILNDSFTRTTWLNLYTAQPKLKAAIVTSIAMVLQPSAFHTTSLSSPPSSLSTATTTVQPPLTNAWQLYAAVGATNNDTDTTQLLMTLSHSPLPETRLAVYSLFRAAALLPTGGQVLMTHSGFLDFMLERSETIKECKDAKFALVQAIYNSPVALLLADNIVQKIKKHIQQGPYYVQTIPWELATE
jgi:hypothetical protein